MQIASEAAGLTELKAKQQSKRYQDEKKKAVESTLQPGTFVLCLEPKHKHGLSAKWQGPYSVKRRLGVATYLLDLGHGREKKRHRNALKVYAPEEVNLCSLITALPDVDAADGVDLEAHCSLAPSTEDSTDVDIDSVDLSHLQGHQQHQIRELLTSYKDVFRDVPDFPAYHLETADSPPVNQPPYRPGLAWRDKVKQAVQKLLDAGYVRPSTSPWSSPVIPVPKPDGSIRLVVDYRKVNSLTQPDKYPIPRMDELINQVGRAKYQTLAKVTTRWH